MADIATLSAESASAAGSPSAPCSGCPTRCPSRRMRRAPYAADAEKERAAGAARRRRPPTSGLRGERAGGTAKDVLEAQAMMAEDPTLERRRHRAHPTGQDRRAGRLRGVRGVPRPAHRAWAATWASAPPTSTTWRSGSSRSCAACPRPGVPDPGHPVRARRPRSRPGRHRAARPRQGARARHDATAARPRTPRSWPARSRSSPIVGVAGADDARRRRRR